MLFSGGRGRLGRGHSFCSERKGDVIELFQAFSAQKQKLDVGFGPDCSSKTGKPYQRRRLGRGDGIESGAQHSELLGYATVLFASYDFKWRTVCLQMPPYRELGGGASAKTLPHDMAG